MNDQTREYEIRRIESAIRQSPEPPLALVKMWLVLKFGLQR